MGNELRISLILLSSGSSPFPPTSGGQRPSRTGTGHETMLSYDKLTWLLYLFNLNAHQLMGIVTHVHVELGDKHNTKLLDLLA